MTRLRCRQCSRALLAQRAEDQSRSESVVDSDGGPSVQTTRLRGRILGYGYAATNFFCSLTCGWMYAVAILRKEEKNKEEEEK